ncbi:Uncharacterised protein [Anaerobiospirillum thomasii]|uniref:Uncharacterized protein n=1 Tax=Anaerobiospirillum thomasii TaxID=179995 RepID=A0A2X0WU87_9GAMM|nr:Uncharacterised protein [Anaerobiospirillum thomasii]
MTKEFKHWMSESMSKEAFLFALISTVLFFAVATLFDFLEIF